MYIIFKIDKNGLFSSDEKNNEFNQFDKNDMIASNIPSNPEIIGTLNNLLKFINDNLRSRILYWACPTHSN